MVMHARKIPRLDENYRDVGHTDLLVKEKNMLSRSSSKYTDKKSSRYDDIQEDRKKDSPKNHQGRSDEVDKLKDRKTHESGKVNKSKVHKQRDHKSDVHRLAERVCGDWSEHTSKSGKRYFYNCTTEVSQWDKPEAWMKEEQSTHTSNSSRSDDKISNDDACNSRAYDNHNSNNSSNRKGGEVRNRSDHQNKYYPHRHNNSLGGKGDRVDSRLSSSKSPNKRSYSHRSGSEDDRGGSSGRRKESRKENEGRGEGNEGDREGGSSVNPLPNDTHNQQIDSKGCIQEDMDISPSNSPNLRSNQPLSTDIPTSTSLTPSNKHSHYSSNSRKNYLSNCTASKTKKSSLLRNNNEIVVNDSVAKENNTCLNNITTPNNITTTSSSLNVTPSIDNKNVGFDAYNTNNCDKNNDTTEKTINNNIQKEESPHITSNTTINKPLSSLSHKTSPNIPSLKPLLSSTSTVDVSNNSSSGGTPVKDPSRQQQQSLQTTLAGLQRAVLQLTPDGVPVQPCKNNDSSPTTFASCVALLPVLLTQLSNLQQASNHTTNHENQLIIQQAIPLLKKLQEMVVHQQQQQQQRKLQTMLLQLLQMQKSDKSVCPSDVTPVKEKAESPYSPPDSDGSPVSSPINNNNNKINKNKNNNIKVKSKTPTITRQLSLLTKPPPLSSTTTTSPQNLLSPRSHHKGRQERGDEGEVGVSGGSQEQSRSAPVCSDAYHKMGSREAQPPQSRQTSPPPPPSSSSSTPLPPSSTSSSSSFQASSSRPSDCFLDNMSSLACHVNNKLVEHVSNWNTDSLNKQANCYSMENHILYGTLCSQISPELKNARSMVRSQEILSTIHEQRVSSIRQQLFEVERGSSSFLPSSTHPYPVPSSFQPSINHHQLFQQQQFHQQSLLKTQAPFNVHLSNQAMHHPSLPNSNCTQVNHAFLHQSTPPTCIQTISPTSNTNHLTIHQSTPPHTHLPTHHSTHIKEFEGALETTHHAILSSDHTIVQNTFLVESPCSLSKNNTDLFKTRTKGEVKTIVTPTEGFSTTRIADNNIT